MSYQLGQALESAAAEPVTLARLADQQEQLLREFRAAERHRRLALLIGAAGAVFAAFRLGILALPTIRSRLAQRRAAAPSPNPRRRRSR